jgi:hypothetical protein
MRERLEAAGAARGSCPRDGGRGSPARHAGASTLPASAAPAARCARWSPTSSSRTPWSIRGALAARALGLPHLWWIHRARSARPRLPLPARPAGHGAGDRRALGRRARLRTGRPRAAPARRSRSGQAPPPALRVAAPIASAPASGPAPARPRLLIAGRVRPSKGQADAVAALAHLPDATLDVVGSGAPKTSRRSSAWPTPSVLRGASPSTAGFPIRRRWSTGRRSRSSARGTRPSGG